MRAASDDSELLTAITHNKVALVRALLANGADPNVDVDDGYTCLLIAAESEDPASIEIMTVLLAAGADVHRAGISGWTPLHLASVRGHVEKARLLIDAGGDVNRRKKIDALETPLMDAAAGGHAELVKLLLEHGADPTMRDEYDHTPLDLARHAAKGADPEVLNTLRAMADAYASRPTETRGIMGWRPDYHLLAERYQYCSDQNVREGDHERVIRILSRFEDDQDGSTRPQS